ncbi:MAG: transaldolase [Actinomycetales bacterium]
MSLEKVSKAGVSIWLDDLSRERLRRDGKATYLKELVDSSHVVGVTTNPAIFSAAISNSSLYKDDIVALAGKGLNPEEIITELTTSDVRNACEIFMPIFEKTNGVDGRVSIEVDPRLARSADETVKQAFYLCEKVAMPNVLIKVPATIEGLAAIRTLTAAGISINVTIIFSLKRYQEVLDSFLLGLEDRLQKGMEISKIHSVASFFVSRVDTEIDPRLDSLMNGSLRGKAALANARLAYQHFSEVKTSDRWKKISAQGGNLQRPLWASTGVKDPTYDPTLYVLDLVASETVNTMPEGTLNAVRISERFSGDTISGMFTHAHEHLNQLKSIGIDIDEVALKLEREGIEKFINPWNELISVVERASIA